jgi:hypothetical protein
MPAIASSTSQTSKPCCHRSRAVKKQQMFAASLQTTTD